VTETTTIETADPCRVSFSQASEISRKRKAILIHGTTTGMPWGASSGTLQLAAYADSLHRFAPVACSRRKTLVGFTGRHYSTGCSC